MKRGAAWLAFGLALGVAALVFVLRDRERASEERAEVNATPAPAHAPASLELNAAADDSPAQPDEVWAEVPNAPRRTAVATETLDASGGPWVRVIARSGGASLPNAAVYWCETRGPGFEATLRALGPDHARGPWPAGTQRFVTGADGRAQLPRTRERVSVVAFTPGRVGSRALMADWRAAFTIQLTDAFYARIVTAAGEPVSGARASCSVATGDVESDAAGRVVFELVSSRSSDPMSKLQLVVRRPLAQDVTFEFPADEPCVSWKLLTPAREGALRVNVPDASAMLGKSSGHLYVQRLTRVSGRGSHPPSVRVPLVGSTGVATDVPFDLEFDISVQLDGVSGWLTARVPGPHRNSDGAIVHELRCADFSFGVLHLVDDRARPIANTQVVADINAHRTPSSEKAVTDAQGTLYVLLEDHFAPGEPRRLWLDVPEMLTTQLDLPGAFLPGVIDLGTVQCAPDEAARSKARPTQAHEAK